MYSLKEAAEKTGKGKSAFLKAIQKGRISAKKDELGHWQIDPAELHRVYPFVSGTGSGTSSSEHQEPSQETGLLKREIAFLLERIADKDSVIEDLRQRLDTAAEERRRLTLLLTDQRPQAVRRSWRGRIVWAGWMLVSVLGVILLALVFRELVGLVISS